MNLSSYNGVASNARCCANASRGFSVECDVGEICIQRLVAAKIEHLAPGECDHMRRDQRDARDIGLHLLLKAVVDRSAFGRIDLRLATLQQLVNLRIVIVGSVRERHARLEVLRPVEALRADSRVRTRVGGIDDRVEITPGIDAIHELTEVRRTDVQPHTDLLQIATKMLRDGREWTRRCGIVSEREPDALCIALESGAFEQRLGLREIKRVRGHIGCKEGREGFRDWRLDLFRITQPDVLHNEITIERMRKSLAYARIAKLRAVEIEFERGGTGDIGGGIVGDHYLRIA